MIKKLSLLLALWLIPWWFSSCNTCGDEGGVTRLVVDKVQWSEFYSGNSDSVEYDATTVMRIDLTGFTIAARKMFDAGTATACKPYFETSYAIAIDSAAVLMADSAGPAYPKNRSLSHRFSFRKAGQVNKTNLDSFNKTGEWKYHLPYNYALVNMTDKPVGVNALNLKLRVYFANGKYLESGTCKWKF